jgi:hypothetical protein
MAHSSRTFKQLRDEVLGWLDETGTTGTMRTNVDNALNAAHKSRLTAEKWPFMLWVLPETLTMESGKQAYALHHEFHMPFYFFNRTKKCYLREVSARQLQPSGARWNSDQDNQLFCFWGRSPVAVQPSAAGVITIVSDNAADTGSTKALTIKGVTANGTEEETLTPSGTTPVVSTKSFSTILGVTKAAVWSGNLTMTHAQASGTILTLLPNEYARSHQQIYMLGAPTVGDVIEYRFYRLPKDLEDDNDLTDFPPGHEQLLVWDTLLAIAAYDNRFDSVRVNEWRSRQKDSLTSLRDAHLEVQPVAASAQYVVDNDSEVDVASNPTVWLP